LLLAAAAVIRPALSRLGAADRPAVAESSPPAAAPTADPASSPAPAARPNRSPLTAWTGHAAIYVVAQAALAVAGYSWPTEALFNGPHDAAWFWNSSGHWLLNLGRIWTAIFVLDTVWTLGRIFTARTSRG
jgi:hypothetical protein